MHSGANWVGLVAERHSRDRELPRARSGNAAGIGTSARDADDLPGDGVSLMVLCALAPHSPPSLRRPDPTARGAYPLGREVEKSPRPACKLTSTRFLTGSQPGS